MDNTPSNETLQNRLIPVTKWNDYHPWPPIGGLRHLIFNEHRNGFHAVVKRIGKRVLINEAKFFEWTNNNPQSAIISKKNTGQDNAKK